MGCPQIYQRERPRGRIYGAPISVAGRVVGEDQLRDYGKHLAPGADETRSSHGKWCADENGSVYSLNPERPTASQLQSSFGKAETHRTVHGGIFGLRQGSYRDVLSNAIQHLHHRPTTANQANKRLQHGTKTGKARLRSVHEQQSQITLHIKIRNEGSADARTRPTPELDVSSHFT